MTFLLLNSIKNLHDEGEVSYTVGYAHKHVRYQLCIDYAIL